MRAPISQLSVFILAFAACHGGIVVTPSAAPDVLEAPDVSSAPDDGPTEVSVVPPPDVPRATDLGDQDRVPTEPIACATDDSCAPGRLCLQGRCAANACVTSANPCGGDRCEMRCVPTRDLCNGVLCGSRETCFQGRCVSGCFPDPCAGVNCPAGQFCDARTGTCARITPCSAQCGDGYACAFACLPYTICDGVRCPADQFCVDGTCWSNPCAGVTCTGSSLCVAGRCVDTCACDPPCTRSPRDRCVVGQCVCATTCTPTTPCGADDGCGGRCVGACDTPAATCVLPAYVCR